MNFFKGFFFIAFLLLSHCSYCNEHHGERLNFALDNKKWKRAFQNSNPEATIVEFTLKDENVDHWSELVTLQKIPPIDNIEKYYKDFINNLKKTVGPKLVQSRVINKSSNSLFFEWAIINNPLAQHEWFKLIKTPHSTLILRYTTKKIGDIEKVRNHWEKILNEASVSKSH